MAVFNRVDGDLAMGSKTPVSILQEILQKKGMVPQYELIFNGVEMKEPLYKFRVMAENMTAIGDGKSKKEAKHDAAATLLKRLLGNREYEGSRQESVDINQTGEVDIASPYTGSIKMNCVGKLDEICFINKIPNASYVLVSEEGPPHARIFTMKCILASLNEVAVARTKKQAKHLVAQKMIDLVEKVLKKRFIPASDNEEPQEEIVSDQEKIRNGTFHHDLSLEVKNLHNVFHLRKDEVPLPSIFLSLPEKTEEFYELMESPLEFLEEVVTALEGIVKETPMSREEIVSCLNDMVDFFEDGLCNCEEEYEEIRTGEVGSEINNVEYILPDFPLSDSEEDKKPSDALLTESKVDKCVEKVRNIEISDDYTPVYSTIKVEIPLGLWDFIGSGRTDTEASEIAARQALNFLRIMAIPPLHGLSSNVE